MQEAEGIFHQSFKCNNLNFEKEVNINVKVLFLTVYSVSIYCSECYYDDIS